MIPYKQLSLEDIFQDCQEKFGNDKPMFCPSWNNISIWMKWSAHPLINPRTFLGDAAFDSVGIYESLLSGDAFGKNRRFSKAYISLNERSKLKDPDYTLNADGVPCCPHNPDLPMKPDGTAKTESGLLRYKFVCPMVKWIYDPITRKTRRSCNCNNPCTKSSCGRMVYVRQENTFVPFRAPFAERMNGKIHISCEPLSKETSITSRKTSVSLVVVRKMKRPCMPT